MYKNLLLFKQIGKNGKKANKLEATVNCQFFKKFCLFKFLYRELKHHNRFSILICKQANKLEATVNCRFE